MPCKFGDRPQTCTFRFHASALKPGRRGHMGVHLMPRTKNTTFEIPHRYCRFVPRALGSCFIHLCQHFPSSAIILIQFIKRRSVTKKVTLSKVANLTLTPYSAGASPAARALRSRAHAASDASSARTTPRYPAAPTHRKQDHPKQREAHRPEREQQQRRN